MAVSNKAVFECRPATGNDLNGGGFIPGATGTDFSQQAAAQATFNGTTVTAVNGGTSATITLTGYTVSAADVGNLLRQASGTNVVAGLFQIISVNVGANTWTLDRNASSGAMVAMVGRMGGALATLVQFFTDADANTLVTGGYSCYVVGTMTVTAAIVIAGQYNTNVAGSSTATTLGGVSVIGYTATRGDNGQFTLTTATNSVDLLHFSNNCCSVNFYNCAFTTSAGTVGMGAAPTTASSEPCRIAFHNCTFTGLKRAIWCDGPGNNGAFIGLYLRNCVVTGSTVDGIVNSSHTVMMDCYIYSNTGDGTRMEWGGIGASGPFVGVRTTWYGNTGKGLYNQQLGGKTQVGQNTHLYNCNFVSNTGDGLGISVSGNNGLAEIIVENNIFYGNGGFGFNCTVLFGFYFGASNAYGGNTSGPYGGVVSALSGDVSLSGDPFNGRTTNDFSLNNTSGAGAACRQAGYPGVLQLGGTGYADIGQLSPQASGGGTTVIAPSKTNYIFLGEEA